MKLLLDESLARRLGRLLVGHEVVTVSEAGWSGLTNGRLLTVAQDRFDCLLTVDRSLVFQQALPKFAIPVLVLRARTNRLADLAPLVPRISAGSRSFVSVREHSPVLHAGLEALIVRESARRLIELGGTDPGSVPGGRCTRSGPGARRPDILSVPAGAAGGVTRPLV